MPEPVNPSDHSIPKLVYDTDRDQWAGMQLDALTEAIHQTFERDAAWLVASEKWRKQVTAYNCNPNPERGRVVGYKPVGKFRFFRVRPTVEYPWNQPRRTPDPNTEIDRLARLIVDGEYRRRAEQEPSQ